MGDQLAAGGARIEGAVGVGGQKACGRSYYG